MPPSTGSRQAYAEVIGDPIAQSKSPLIHMFWIAQLGLDAHYRAQAVAPEALAQYLFERKGDANWRGCNVTMPHKQAVLPLLDRLDPTAEKIGAVNTVVRSDDGVLTGYNTDVVGFLEPLRDELSGHHLFRMTRVIGTGGAARAIVAGLAGEGFTIVLAGRDPEKAARLLEELGGPTEHFNPPLSHFCRSNRLRLRRPRAMSRSRRQRLAARHGGTAAARFCDLARTARIDRL